MYHKYRKKPEKEDPNKYKKKSPNKFDHTPPPPRPRFQSQKTPGNQKVRQLYKESNAHKLARAIRARAFIQGNDENNSTSYTLQIIEILDNPPNHDIGFGCQRAWEILVPLDDDLFVRDRLLWFLSSFNPCSTGSSS